MKIDASIAKVGDWRVDIIESERGWGSHVEETHYFTDKEEAATWAREYNKKWNPDGPVPDWYMVAEQPRQLDKVGDQLGRVVSYHLEFNGR